MVTFQFDKRVIANINIMFYDISITDILRASGKLLLICAQQVLQVYLLVSSQIRLRMFELRQRIYWR